MKVGVIDYGVGNLGSVVRAIQSLDSNAALVQDPTLIGDFDRLVLPGVGNYAACAELLRVGNWQEPIRLAVQEQEIPLLGICVGMQLLGRGSEEVGADGLRGSGLNLIPGYVSHLQKLGCRLRLPHVGWNNVILASAKESLFTDVPEADYYFVHSYCFIPDVESSVIAKAEYGVEFAAAIHSGHVWGTQFHPEKSSRAGLAVLKNFIEAV